MVELRKTKKAALRRMKIKGYPNLAAAIIHYGVAFYKKKVKVASKTIELK